MEMTEDGERQKTIYKVKTRDVYISDNKRGRTKVQHPLIRATEHIKWKGEERYITDNKGKIKINRPV